MRPQVQVETIDFISSRTTKTKGVQQGNSRTSMKELATTLRSTNLRPTGYRQGCKSTRANAWAHHDPRTLKRKRNERCNHVIVASFIPKNHSIPQHYVIVLRCPAYARRRVLHQPLEVPHQPLPWRSRHPQSSAKITPPCEHTATKASNRHITAQTQIFANIGNEIYGHGIRSRCSRSRVLGSNPPSSEPNCSCPAVPRTRVGEFDKITSV